MVKRLLTRVSRPLNGKRQFFQQKVLGKLDIHIQKNEVGPLSIPGTKINPNWINVRPKTIRLLEENIGQRCTELVYNDFLDKTAKAQETKKNFDFMKKTIKDVTKVKSNNGMGENIFLIIYLIKEYMQNV